jgi:hypothetical protein
MVDQMGLNDAAKIKDSLRQSVIPSEPMPGGETPPEDTELTGNIDAFLKSLPVPVVQYIIKTIPPEQQNQVIQKLMQMPQEELVQAITGILHEIGGTGNG